MKPGSGLKIDAQKCLIQPVRKKEEFVFMEKWQINRFQLWEQELRYLEEQNVQLQDY